MGAAAPAGQDFGRRLPVGCVADGRSCSSGRAPRPAATTAAAGARAARRAPGGERGGGGRRGRAAPRHRDAHPDAAVARGLAGVRWPARVELVSERPVVVLDTAHNVPSAPRPWSTPCRESLPGRGRKARRVRGVVGQAYAGDAPRPGRVLRPLPPDPVRPQPAVRAAGEARRGCWPRSRRGSRAVHPTAAEAWAAARAAAGAGRPGVRHRLGVPGRANCGQHRLTSPGYTAMKSSADRDCPPRFAA